MYLKILRGDLKQHNMQYKEGLNVDILPFNPAPECGEGLFFADEKHILSCCNYGDKIAVVTIPEGEQIVEVNICGDIKYKSHRIILSEIRDLWTVETFKYLVGLGANIHADDNYALRYAALNGHLEIVKCLVEAGANIHVKEDCALRHAAEYGYLEIVKYLLECGANLNKRHNYALRQAAGNGHLEIVKCLIEYGANIHVWNDDALFWAALNGHLEVVKYLIKHGANIYAENRRVLFLATINRQSKVVDYLKSILK